MIIIIYKCTLLLQQFDVKMLSNRIVNAVSMDYCAIDKLFVNTYYGITHNLSDKQVLSEYETIGVACPLFRCLILYFAGL